MKIHCERGIALIAVLWALLFLTSAGTAVAVIARQQVWTASSHGDRAAARWAAEAGVAVAEIRVEALLGRLRMESVPEADEVLRRRFAVRALNTLDSLFSGEREASLADGVTYGITIRDATTRLNLNAAGEPELRAFFRRWVRDERALSIVVHSLLDWRDEDDLEHAQGAETEYYAQLPRPYRARNALLLSSRELLLVRGITPQVFREVEPYVVVQPTARLRINLNTAPAPVLAAIPGFSPELAERVVERRRLVGAMVNVSEIGGDPELSRLLVRAEAAGAVNVAAVYPELLEIRAVGRSGASEYRIDALYTLAEEGRMRRVQRVEEGG